jgi:hypothetical protein
MALRPTPTYVANENGAGLDRAALEASTLRYLRPRSRTRPDLRLLEWNGRLLVAKDWSCAHPLLRGHARRSLAREWRALDALRGVSAVPEAITRLPDAIVLAYVEGEPFCRKHPHRRARKAFFDALAASLAEIHARGVVHLDLRQRRNILCDREGRPRVLDFEAAFVLDPSSRFGRLALRAGRRVDRLALLKHRARFTGWLLAPGEKRLARAVRVSRWVWPSTLLHHARVALRRRRRGGS